MYSLTIPFHGVDVLDKRLLEQYFFRLPKVYFLDPPSKTALNARRVSQAYLALSFLWASKVYADIKFSLLKYLRSASLSLSLSVSHTH